MRFKNLAFLLCTALLFSMLAQVGSVFSETDSFSFHGIGVAVDFSFPIEAHPSDIITHNVTITSTTDVVLQNITLFVYAPVGLTLQLVNVSHVSLPYVLPAGQSLPNIPVRITLPANTNGTLRCLLYVKTDQSSDYASATFLTTQVRSVSYGELVDNYSDLLANYSKLLAQYENLLDEYNVLLQENTVLIASQEILLNENTALKANYTRLLNSQSALQGEYNQLEASYQSLLSEYNDLAANYASLNENNTNLQEDLISLEETNGDLQKNISINRITILVFMIAIVGLIALVVYVRHKKQDPYLVIRKETVSLDQDKKE